MVQDAAVPALPPVELKPLPGNPYVTSGTTTNPKLAAEEDAPNYAPAISVSVSCGACKAFKEETPNALLGYCSTYDFYPRHDFSCDAWSSRNAAVIRQKLRGL